MKFLISILLLLPTSLLFAHTLDKSELSDTASDIRESASQLAKFSKENKPGLVPSQLLFDFDDAKRQTIDFFPLYFHQDIGVTFGLMKDPPALATQSLLRELLSEEGYLRSQMIQSMEDVLRNSTPNERTFYRQSDAYQVQMFGNPSSNAPFGIKYEGHHLSLNITIVDGKVRGTPLFLGANPSQVEVGLRRGMRVLAPHEDLPRKLLESLNKDQLAKATGSKAKPGVARGELSPVVKYTGLSASDMTKVQRSLLMASIQSFAGMLQPSIAHEEMQRIESAGIENLHFIWNGSPEPGAECYYRIQGPAVLIEFQNLNGSHIHSLWRNPETDFGHDLLHDHLEHAHSAH